MIVFVGGIKGLALKMKEVVESKDARIQDDCGWSRLIATLKGDRDNCDVVAPVAMTVYDDLTSMRLKAAAFRREPQQCLKVGRSGVVEEDQWRFKVDENERI